MIRGIIGTIITLSVVCIILFIVVPAAFPSTAPMISDMRSGIQFGYNWAVANWGASAVGLTLVILLIGISAGKR
ncbi:TPA: hypothetical protein VAP34_002114 [Streptococcus agalactiae]|nr:hypothetical protein [Streptococcus agalactiae]